MNTRKLTILLIAIPALLFCVAAAASEFPIDSSGAQARSETSSGSSTSSVDCPQTSSATGTHASKYTSDLAGDQSGDNAGTSAAGDASATSKDAATRSGGSSGNLSAPKIRTNRWQSLVPGAIK